MYHGTEIERGNRMLRKQKMDYSRDNEQTQHWLGDGIYLYKDCFYAFRWIVLMFKKRYKQINLKSELYTRYSILKVDIDYNYECVFSFTNPEHQIVFDKIRDECKKKGQELKGFQKYKYVDGLIINIMFKKLNYGEHYDMVEAVFPLDNIKNMNSRIQSLNEYQLCVKNPEIIKIIEDYSEMVDYNTFSEKLKKFDNYRISLKDQYIYKTNLR